MGPLKEPVSKHTCVEGLVIQFEYALRKDVFLQSQLRRLQLEEKKDEKFNVAPEVVTVGFHMNEAQNHQIRGCRTSVTGV